MSNILKEINALNEQNNVPLVFESYTGEHKYRLVTILQAKDVDDFKKKAKHIK